MEKKPIFKNLKDIKKTMRSNRYIFLVTAIASIILIIITANFANAGILDKIFGKDEGLSPFPTTVSLTSTPPGIVKFYDPTPPFNGPYQPVVGSQTLAYFAFVADDPDGSAQLPDVPGTNILGGLQAPLSSVNPSLLRVIFSCGSINCQTGGVGGTPYPECNPARLIYQKAYGCAVSLNPTDPPSTGATPTTMWRISVLITDTTGASSAVVNTGDPGFPQGVQVNTLSAYSIPVGLTWNSITTTGTNQLAGAPLTVNNLGNIALPTASITGNNLQGINIPTATMSINAFSGGPNTGGAPPAQCNVAGGSATQLTTTAANIPSAGLQYTASGSDSRNLYFCIPPILNTPGLLTNPAPGPQYDSSYSGSWDITYS